MNKLKGMCSIILCGLFIIISPRIANANSDIDATISELYRLEETIYTKWNGLRGFYTYEGQTNMNKMSESIRRIGKKYKWGIKEQINKPKQLISQKKNP
ncbi:hypothetical protein [Enterococcus avium]|uniref:hypothetical protein n=1 Tax=Enterococcus avium TaxID=33945 RepID=UPI001F5A6805|nr:hypothetical protein [Enterococcus avium]